MFKAGQRVVFVDCQLPRNPSVVYPEIHEVVTIESIFFKYGHMFISLKEYHEGSGCGILAICFRPIDETFAEGVLKKIEEEIQEEELICLK